MTQRTVPAEPHRSRSTAAASGRVLMWPGGSVWVSRQTGLVQPHAHHAMQLVLAPDQAILLRSASDTAWQAVQAAIVMADRRHQLDGSGSDLVIIFVEPETTAGRALTARFGGADFSVVEHTAVLGLARSLLAAHIAGADNETLLSEARHIVNVLAEHDRDAESVDPRIVRVLAWIQAHLDNPITLAQAAAIAHLSPGRFRHLFVQQTGISFRAYLLWERVKQAVTCGLAGESWTTAAQRSGFADSAHLSRMFRRMFGLAPSMLGKAE